MGHFEPSLYRSPNLPMTTQAAEGLPRRRWTVAEIEAAQKAGIIDEDERFELIEGEIVPMAAKGIRHELIKTALNKYWVQRLPEGIELAPETTFRMTEDTFVEPDFVFYRSSDGLAKLSPETALLAVEVADTSVYYDLGRKARIYARMNVREMWVIKADDLVTHIHRQAGPDGYLDKPKVNSDQMLIPWFANELAVKLKDLKLV